MIDLQQNNRNSLIYILINSIIYLFFFFQWKSFIIRLN